MCRFLVCLSFFQFVVAQSLFAPLLPYSRDIKPMFVRCLSEIANRFSLALSNALPVIGLIDPIPAIKSSENLSDTDILQNLLQALPVNKEHTLSKRRRFESCPDTATTSALLLRSPLADCSDQPCALVLSQTGVFEKGTLLLSAKTTEKDADPTSNSFACAISHFRSLAIASLMPTNKELTPQSPSPTHRLLHRRNSLLSDISEECIPHQADHWNEILSDINTTISNPDLKNKGLRSAIQQSTVYRKLPQKELEAATIQTKPSRQPEIQETRLRDMAHSFFSISNIDKKPSTFFTVEVPKTAPFTACLAKKKPSITHDNTQAVALDAQFARQSSGHETSYFPVHETLTARALFKRVLNELTERIPKTPFGPYESKCYCSPSHVTKPSGVLQIFFCALRHVNPTKHTVTPHSHMVKFNTPKRPSDQPSTRKHRPTFSQADDATRLRSPTKQTNVSHRLAPQKIPYAFYSGLPLLLTTTQTLIPGYQSTRFQKKYQEVADDKVLRHPSTHTKNRTSAEKNKSDKTNNQTSRLQKEPDEQDKVPQEKPQVLHPFRNERSQEINCWIKRIALSTTFITLGAFLITLLKLSLF